MSTFFEETKSCVICNNSSVQIQIGSTNSFGSPDLDLRPPEMQRSTMCHWIEVCPHCGYVANNISTGLDESDEKKKKGFAKFFAHEANVNNEFSEWLSSEEYKECKGIQFKSDLAKNFYQHHLILIKYNKISNAFFALRNAAWACDDAKDEENAIICRLKAIEYLNSIIESADEDEQANFELIKADMLRRSKKFEELITEFANKHYKDDILNKIISFQIVKAREKDNSCYTVENTQIL